MAFTNDEIQSIVSAVLSSLQTNSKTIDQLTSVMTLSDSDVFEIGGGKKVTYKVLSDLIASLSTEEHDALSARIDSTEKDIAKLATNMGEVEIDELDKMESLRHATTQLPAVYRVMQMGHVAGLLLVYSDSGAHEITQEFHTTINLVDGQLAASHKDGSPRVYTRSFNQAQQKWSPWEETPTMEHMGTKADLSALQDESEARKSADAALSGRIGTLEASASDIPGNIELSNIDNVSARYALPSMPSVWRVVEDGHTVGVMLMYSDRMAHAIVQVLHTAMVVGADGVPAIGALDGPARVYSRSWCSEKKTWGQWVESPRMEQVLSKADKDDFIVLNEADFESMKAYDMEKFYFVYED